MANGKIGSEFNKQRWKHRVITSGVDMKISEEWKTAPEQFTMSFREYRRQRRKELRKSK